VYDYRRTGGRDPKGNTLTKSAILIALIALGPIPAGAQVDLAITDATVLDVRSGTALPHRTVLIDHSIIRAILAHGTAPARRTIAAHGRVLTPGIFDVHSHSGMIFGDSVTPTNGYITHLVMTPDSIAAYRRRYAAVYLPYGVTSVRDVGSNEHDLPMLLAWMRDSPSPTAPDFYPCAAQLISPEPGRVAPPFQIELADSAAAAAQVRRYYDLGIRDIKLYWRLHRPAFDGALAAALQLGMRPDGHVGNGPVTIDVAMDLGLRRFEHMLTIPESVMGPAARDSFDAQAITLMALPAGTTRYGTIPGAGFLLDPAEWRYLGPDNPRVLALIDRFRTLHASLTPTLHIQAQRLGLTYFASPPRIPFEDMSAITDAERRRAVDSYHIEEQYVYRFYMSGVRLNLGTDTPDPGKAALSEMLLLHRAGIPMAAVFTIATLHGAEEVGQADVVGTVEPGKRADLILFDRNPLDDPANLLAGKTVIKSGVPF
jgi:hypothetical protein